MAPSPPLQPDPKQKLPTAPPGNRDPDELVRRADEQRGLPAAETLLEAALIYRRRAETVAAMHSLERALAELSELIESPPAARLGAELEYQLGLLCEEELGRFEDALVHYQRAFKLRPDNLDPLRRGRLIYQSLGDMDMVARLIELHLSNLVASETRSGIALALELGQLKLKLNDPAGAVEALRSALRMHNDSAATEEIPEALLATLAEAYVSPDYQPGISEKDHARRHASEIYLSLAKRYLDPKLLESLPHGDGDDEAGHLPIAAPLLAAAGELRDSDKKAIALLRKALEADARNVTAAGLLETLYARLPAGQRTAELIKLYRSGARVSRRGPKLLKIYEEAGGAIDYGAVIDACRTGLDAVNSVDEWNETRDTLKEMLQKSGDQLGLAAVREEDASEAALPEERADLLMQAAELYQRGGDQERYIGCLKQAFSELPLHTEAFRKLSDYYKSRRDFIGLAVLQESRMAAQFETARLDLASYSKQLEELGELYEKKLQDVVSAAAIWRRIDELLPSARSQSERKRLAQRLQRIDQQASELQIELERTPEDQVPQRVELLRRLAQLYRELHEPKHAASVYELLLQLSPADLPSIKILIELREQSGDVPGQLDLLRQQVGLCTDRAERLSLLRRMMALCDQRMLQRDERWDAQDGLGMTIWVCRALLAELPSDRDALRRLSEALGLLGNKSELLDVLEAYLKVAPTPREKLGLHRQIAKVAEDAGDLPRAVSHLERAVRISPPGGESEEALSELSRIYGLQGRTELAVQTLELCLKQNPRASVELFRQLGRLTLVSEEDPALIDKSVRAFREVLARASDDIEALSGLQRLYRRRGAWSELQTILDHLLAVADPPLPPRERITVALELSEVYSERLSDPKKAVELIERVQSESPVVDLRVHRRLRVLYEEMGSFAQAAHYAERELLLTEDPVARMERALDIAALWNVRARDIGRALLAYERVLQIAPQLPEDAPEAAGVRMLVLQALEAMSQMFIAEGRWPEVVLVGQRRLGMALDQGEVVPAANILLELAQIYEEKLEQPADGFALRQQAFDLAPHMVSLDQLSAVAAKYGLWQELCSLHVKRVEQAIQIGSPPPADSALAATQIYERHLGQPTAGFKLLRRALPQNAEAALAATTAGSEYATLLDEMRRLVATYGKAAADDDSEAIATVSMVRDLLLLYRGLVDELCKRKDAGSEEMAVRLHQLLGASARLREEVNADYSGALTDRLHAFTVGGERDHSRDIAAHLTFVETIRELHRMAALSGQIKEAVAVDNRRLERADSDVRRMEIACENAAWLDEHAGDPQRALRACLKALALCEEGSDAQAEMRGRLYRLGQKLGLLAWDEIARAERSLAGTNPRSLRQRLIYLASLWQYGAGDYVRAVDVAGQAFRLCFFPGGLPQAGPSGKSGPPLSALVVANPDAELLAEQRAARAVLERIVLAAPNDSEGNSKLVALLDNLTGQLNEAGANLLAAQVALDAGQVDERRGRMAQAERRYQEALKQPGTVDQALGCLERLYRQQRRLTDLAALLERRRPLIPESAQYGLLLDLAEVYREVNKIGPALTALNQAIALDDRGAAPYLLMARLYEGQRTYTRAVEAYRNAAQRADSDEKALSALLSAAQLSERKLEESAEALELYRAALGRAYAALDAMRAAGRPPEASPQLLSDRDAAWAGAERLLQKAKDLEALDALLVQRLAATPDEPGLGDERTGLLKQRLELLLSRRGATDRADQDSQEAQLLAIIQELCRLHSQDDELLKQMEELLISIEQRAVGRDVALLRARGAAERGAEAAIQTERWLEVSRRELDVNNLGGAEAALEQALQLMPDSLPALRGLIELHRRAGNAAAEARALVRLAERESDPQAMVAAQLQAAAVMQRGLGDTTGARALLNEALSRLAEQSDAGTLGAQAEVLVALFHLERQAEDGEAAADYARRALDTQAVSLEHAAELHEHLGHLALHAQLHEAAQQHFEAAIAFRPGLLGATRALIDLLQPTGDYVRIDQLIAAALSAVQGLSPVEQADLLRRQAETRQAAGQPREAYQALLAAEALSPGDITQQVWLGDSAYELGEYVEAARYLGGLLVYAERPDALPPPLTPERLADALDRGAEAERMLTHTGKARALWQAALRLQPEHAGAADHYLELLLEEGQTADAAEALNLLGGRAERALAAGNVADAVKTYTRGAQLSLTRLGDARRAHELLISAYTQLPTPTAFTLSDELAPDLNTADTSEVAALPVPQVAPELAQLQRQLLIELLESAQRIEEIDQAQSYAEKLAELSEEPTDKSRFLRQAAECALRGGHFQIGKDLLLKGLRYTPGNLDLLSRLAPLFDDSETVALLGVMLEQAVPTEGEAATSQARAQRIELWRHLANAQLRLEEREAAAHSYDQAIAVAQSLGRDSALELELRRAALEILPLDDGERARAHLRALLQAAPLDGELLGRLHALEERSGNAGAAWRLAQVLQLFDPTWQSRTGRDASTAAAPIPVSLRLDESEHVRWALPEARVFGDVLAALWDGVVGLKAPPLDSFGVAGNDKVPGSESSPDEVARTFGLSCRVLGNQRCGMYRQGWQQHLLPKVFARMPTALIVSPALGRRPLAEVQFILGRAVEGLRPEYILAQCLPPRELSHVLGFAVRAFHPRHARVPGEDVASWKRELPYRTVKRLGEVFRDQADTVFSTVVWRRAVRRTLQRAGLLISGDLLAAASVLRTVDLPFVFANPLAALKDKEEPGGPYLRLDNGRSDVDPQAECEADLRDLCAFFLDPQFAPLFDRLHPR